MRWEFPAALPGRGPYERSRYRPAFRGKAGDIFGKLTVLRIECHKCGRRGRYHLHRLIERCGIDAKLSDWSDEITADRPRKHSGNLYDQCGARRPDLPRVV